MPLKPNKKHVLVGYNGTTFDYALIFSGDIGGQRISIMLPDDFTPDHEYFYY
jgi:hypothetical protein